MADHLNTIKDAVIGGKHAEIKGLVQQALDAGTDPGTLINDALIAAMDVVGKDFGEGKIFVPEMLVSAMTSRGWPAARASRAAPSSWPPSRATCTTSARTWSR
jgi:methanogenic corrinoid protein MtbC1